MKNAIPCGNPWQWIPYAGVLFCLLLACISWGSFASIGIWRHDYIGYIDNYELKLATEGRWINYLLFKVLKASPPLVLIGIKLLTIALFVYIAARRYTGSGVLGLVCALALLQAPSIVLESLWPGVSALPYVFLALLAWLYAPRRVHLCLIIAAILFWGTFAYGYFFMPLLFLGDKDLQHQPVRMLRLLVFWVAYFILGYCCCQLMTYLLLGKFFELADWRHAQFASSWAGISANLQEVAFYLRQFLAAIADNALAFIIPASLFLLYKLRKMKNAHLNGISLLVACSVFSFTAISGVSTAWRSILPFWTGLVFFFTLKDAPSRKEKAMISGLLCLFAVSFFPINYNNIQWYKQTVSLFSETITRQLQLAPEDVSEIIMHGKSTAEICDAQVYNETAALSPKYIEKLLLTSRIVPAFRELGYDARVSYEMESDSVEISSPCDFKELFYIRNSGKGPVHVYFPCMENAARH